jgi:ATP-dependent helicase HrpB
VPHGRRKVVLATAIAETSLTIEGVRIVIDAGRMRVSRFDPGSGMSRLVTLNVSRAAADQRRGRAGRSAPGVCWRLWSEGQTASLAPATTPEILEADLAPLALELARWGVSDPAELRWLDSPPAGSLAQARDLLVRLAALDRGGRLTAHGEALSELPLHPRLGHMLVRGIARGQGSEACWLAAMLSERDVLAKQAGPRPADMDLRLRHIKEARPRHVSQVAGKLAERLDVRLAPPSTRHTDELLMLAYPDRLAHRRPGSQPRYVLANGRGVRLPEDDALATAEWLAVAHLDGAQREGRIFLAAATSRSRIEDVFADEIEDCEVIEWDDTAEAVVARNERRLGALALQSRVQPHPDPDRTTELLLEAIRRKGLQVLPWTKSAKAWLDRARFAATLAEDASPAMTDEALLGSLEDWLAPFLGGMSRLKHLDKLDLLGALTYRLGPQQSARLDAIAPAKIQLHNNKKFPLDYETGEPVLAVRLQDVFGLAETPRVAEGRMPVTLHLLSPARRPVQITRDLASFWKNGYREVRKEMKGRYPKHEWPESPGA